MTSQYFTIPNKKSVGIYPLHKPSNSSGNYTAVWKLEYASDTWRVQLPAVHVGWKGWLNPKIVQGLPATYTYIWVFPKIMVPPNHPFVHRVFQYFHHPFCGEKSWKIPLFLVQHPYIPLINQPTRPSQQVRNKHMAGGYHISHVQVCQSSTEVQLDKLMLESPKKYRDTFPYIPEFGILPSLEFTG